MNEQKYAGIIIACYLIGMIIAITWFMSAFAIPLMDAEREQGWKHYCNQVMFGDGEIGYNIQKIEEHCK